MLDAHNAVRARVGVPPLVWSDQLAEVAQDWANQLVATGGLSHRPNNRYGENIYTLSGGTVSPAQVVDFWAAEARGYDIRSNTCRGVCGHYTQVVWGKTRAVGCAVAADRRREVWVCNYDPPWKRHRLSAVLNGRRCRERVNRSSHQRHSFGHSPWRTAVRDGAASQYHTGLR